jgi:UMP-CMP kinase
MFCVCRQVTAVNQKAGPTLQPLPRREYLCSLLCNLVNLHSFRRAAGKGTQCARLVADYGYVHLSAGDLLRAEREAGGPVGDMINEFIREGKIVPVEVTVNLLRKAMVASGALRFLVDGFPRNINNLEGWQSVMGRDAVVDGVLVYDCPESIMEARLLERGKTSGRTDDNLESIKKRFSTHVRETAPVIQYFADLGKVRIIEANAAVEKVCMCATLH